jgi:hypothetical protein
MKYTSIITLVSAAMLAAHSADAALVSYYNLNGQYNPAFDNAGTLGAGGSLGGQTTGSFTAANYLGPEDGYFLVVNGAGVPEAYTYGGVYTATFQSPTLSGGVHNGLLTKNPNYLGTTTNQTVFSDATGIVGYYANLNSLYVDYTWSSFSGGGSLAGVSPVRGMGLKDIAGNMDMTEGYYQGVAPDGTLEFYELVFGTYASGLESTYGSWSTFTNGPLAGLTLTALNGAATGTANGTPYRFLGTSNGAMVFEVPTTTVPEPTSGVLALGACLTALRRRRQA